jgi:hypothetical protein
MLSFYNQLYLSRVISVYSLTGKSYFIARTEPEKVPRRSSLSSQMGRSTETPWNIAMSSPRRRKLASSAMPSGYSLFLSIVPDLNHISPGEGLVGLSFFLAASLLQVGDAFQEPTARQELNAIGSAPSQDHVFKVDNFVALGSIQKQLQEKIFAVEGTWEANLNLTIEGVPPQLSSAVFTVHPVLQVTKHCSEEPKPPLHVFPLLHTPVIS